MSPSGAFFPLFFND
jgi:hypothetical protein